MDDVYGSPEKHGLKIFETVEQPNMSYEFNMFVVWEHDDGRLFYASDSGCSWPSPFEDFHSLSQLTPITKGDSFRSFQDAFNAWRGRAYVSKSAAEALFDKVKGRLLTL